MLDSRNAAEARFYKRGWSFAPSVTTDSKAFILR